MSNRRVVVIEGEDAGAEAVRAALPVVDALGLDIEWLHPLVGVAAREHSGSLFPEAARKVIDASDATLFGATSGPCAPALFYLRWGKGTFANVRPVRFRPGARTPLARPEGLDLVIVRENLEDLYLGIEGDSAELAALGRTNPRSGEPLEALAPGRFAIKVITEAGSARVVRHAFGLARERRGRLTATAKYNMLPRSDGLFMEVAERVAADFPDVAFERLIVDDCAHRLVVSPQAFDVLVMPNLYGDILSDLAGGLGGGLGLAPSGCYGSDYAYFESAHGTAPDLAGRNIVNPTATLLSAAMMLAYLGFADAAGRLETAVDRVYADGAALTPDQGGSATTTQLCSAVAERL